MLVSSLHFPTLKEAPTFAETDGFKMLYRAGYLRESENSTLVFLPLFDLSLAKVEKLLIDKVFQERSNRLSVFQNKIIDDRFLSEISILELLADDIQSYKKLPVGFHFFSSKEQKNPKYSAGLLRAASSYELTHISISETDQTIDLASRFDKLLSQLGVKFYKTDGEIIYYYYSTDLGDIELLNCNSCHSNFTENSQISQVNADIRRKTPRNDSNKELFEMKAIFTPNVKTVDELAAFLNISNKEIVKTLICTYKDKVFAALIRGDRELSLNKLANVLDIDPDLLKNTDSDTVLKTTGALPGSVGPVGLKIPIFIDQEVAQMKNFVTGANKDDYHLLNVNFNHDFTAKICDLKKFDLSECPNCNRPLKPITTVAFAKTFSADRRQKIYYLDENGKNKLAATEIISIDLLKLLGILTETYATKDGLNLPEIITPFQVVIVPINIKDTSQKKLAFSLYNQLKESSIEVLLDDRHERAGSKFKDFELASIPYRITVGKRTNEGLVEIKNQKTYEEIELPIEQVVAYFDK